MANKMIALLNTLALMKTNFMLSIYFDKNVMTEIRFAKWLEKKRHRERERLNRLNGEKKTFAKLTDAFIYTQ